MGQEGSKDIEGLQDQIPPQNGANNENQKFGAPLPRKDHVKTKELRDQIGTNESIMPNKQLQGASAMANPVPVDADQQKQSMTHGFDQELQPNHANEQTISDKQMSIAEGNTRTQLPSTELRQNGDDTRSNRNQELQNPSAEKTDERHRLTKPPPL